MYQKQILKNAPTLNTILMVEDTLNNMEDSVTTLANLKKILPKKINHNTLKEVISYLYKSNKILFCPEGILWIYNDNPNLRKAIKEGYVWKPEKSR